MPDVVRKSGELWLLVPPTIQAGTRSLASPVIQLMTRAEACAFASRRGRTWVDGPPVSGHPHLGQGTGNWG